VLFRAPWVRARWRARTAQANHWGGIRRRLPRRSHDSIVEFGFARVTPELLPAVGLACRDSPRNPLPRLFRSQFSANVPCGFLLPHGFKDGGFDVRSF
jgi:hypothetical protein